MTKLPLVSCVCKKKKKKVCLLIISPFSNEFPCCLHLHNSIFLNHQHNTIFFFTRLRKKTKGKERDYNLKKVPAALEDESNLTMKSSH